MRARRRIDWSEILAPDAPAPIWREQPARSEWVRFAQGFGPLFEASDPEAFLTRAVTLALELVGFVRAGIYLYDERLDLMIGTWGTDLRRRVVDERHAMFRLDEAGRRLFERAAAGQAHWGLVENAPIIANEPAQTKVVGRGWTACTPIVSGGKPIGMMYNDAGMTDAAVDPIKQERGALLCSIAGFLLARMREARRGALLPVFGNRHPAVAKAIVMLAVDPSLSGTKIAAALHVSPSRFARVFKADTGVSLVEHRNRLRLDRFFSLVDGDETNFLEAALAAGFGSYAQFSRVFRALRGMTPRAYLTRRRRQR